MTVSQIHTCRGSVMDKFDYIADGQMSFADYFQKPIPQPKCLVDFINGMGTPQLLKIKYLVMDALEQKNCEIPNEVIMTITNKISTWQLEVSIEYEKYLKNLLQGEKKT